MLLNDTTAKMIRRWSHEAKRLLGTPGHSESVGASGLMNGSCSVWFHKDGHVTVLETERITGRCQELSRETYASVRAFNKAYGLIKA